MQKSRADIEVPGFSYLTKTQVFLTSKNTRSFTDQCLTTTTTATTTASTTTYYSRPTTYHLLFTTYHLSLLPLLLLLLLLRSMLPRRQQHQQPCHYCNLRTFMETVADGELYQGIGASQAWELPNSKEARLFSGSGLLATPKPEKEQPMPYLSFFLIPLLDPAPKYFVHACAFNNTSHTILPRTRVKTL